ncbi:uncharacterized protein BT62DRAFT_146033 [Guyanagaster necrorhizus]|uniref:F-box domain-containing protein n=1 Tax=Guyanagaster necrorhizus TaxID=856835 RepID=A0A9P7VR93_9AGAR|nr:uncharacterized protein BT62DRAFT_146033 [Guyanagaster necrorhizus MCA 3950]KAG7445978.1 hypothetical protein BT62DRAFT_146033 [Guyanagaster necrorhizus MCA 3950]
MECLLSFIMNLSSHYLQQEAMLRVMSHGRRQVTRLPAELIITIFFHCLPDKSYPSLHKDVAPLLLAHVCRSWRALALSVSRLWSFFEIDFHNGYAAPRLEALEFWLKLSKEQPLSFDVIYDPPTHTTSRVFQPRSITVVKALLCHSSRWRDVRFVTPGASLVPLFTDPPLASGLHSLETLTLDMRGVWPSHGVALCSLGIQWSRLSELHVRLDCKAEELPTLDEIFDILSEGENLMACSFNATCTFTPKADPTRVSMTKLQRLNLSLRATSGSEPCFAYFLDSLSMVALRALRIECMDDLNGRNWNGCRSILSCLRSAVIRELQLYYLPLSTADVTNILDATPELERLNLKFDLGDRDEDPVNDVLFRHILLSKALRALDIECHGRKLNCKVVMDIVELGRLERLHLATFIPICNCLEAHWERGRIEGVDVRLSHYFCY